MPRNLPTSLRLLAVLAFTLSFALVACGGDDDVLPGTDLNGDWLFTWTVTAASGPCAGEVGEVSSNIITIAEEVPVQVGSEIVMSGFLGVPGNTVEGELLAGDQVEVFGSYPEDGGTTTADYILDIVTADRMEGTESWSFVNGASNCPTNESSVVAVRQ